MPQGIYIRKKPNYRKGKKYSEIYKDYSKIGFKKGKDNPSKNPEFRKKSSERLKGKTYEELYGEEIAQQKKEKMSKTLKGKSYENLMGKEKADKLKKLRSESQIGEKSSSWLGGISKSKRKIKKIDILFRNQIRKRDNQICMLCGVHREKLKRVLDVHHINYIKSDDCFENCIALCHSCHQKTNYNRRHWFNMFKNILHEKYGYEYSDNIKVIKFNDKEVQYETKKEA